MLGWELPPRISGGLGVACYGLGVALSRMAHVSWELPPQWQTETIWETRMKSHKVDFFSAYASGEEMMQEVYSYTRRSIARAKNPNFDIIHAHDWLTWEAGVALKILTGKPLVMHVHSLAYDREGKNFRQGAIYAIERRSLAHADAIIAVSQYTKAALEVYYDIPAHKITVAHNALSLDELPNNAEQVQLRRTNGLYRHEYAPLVSFVGRITQQKNPLAFVRIAASVAAAVPQARFCVAGDGDMREEMQALAHTFALDDRISFRGFLNRAEVYNVLEQTQVMVVPSVSEPFGIVALEAALSGAGMVLSRQCGAREVLPAVPAFDWWDEDAFSEQVIDMLQAPYRHSYSPIAAYQQVRQHTWLQAAQAIMAVYETLV